MPLQPHRERAQAAQAEIDVVGPFAQPGEAHGILEVRDRRRIGRDGAEHHVGMAADIFGAGLDREIDAVVERAEIERRRPGIVHQDQRAFGVRGLGDGGGVLHFEAQRARRFEIDRAGVRAGISSAIAAPIERIVIGRRDAEPREDAVAEIARRPIGAVGDEQMVAGIARPTAGRSKSPRARTAAAIRRRIAALRAPAKRVRALRWSACRGGHIGSARGGRQNPPRSDRARSRRDRPAD